MRYFVRKITLSKWPKPHGSEPETGEYDVRTLRADAVADIRTFNDSLSIWSIPSDSEADIDEAVLALATSVKQERLETMDIVVFAENDVTSRGLRFEDAEGETAVTDLRNSHQNITGLTYESLSSVMEIIADITVAGRHKRLTQRHIEKLVKNNLQRIDVDAFANDLMKEKIRGMF